MQPKKPTVLVVLDGFGFRSQKENNAIAQADMPHVQSWLNAYPHTLLKASGTAVGLPDGVIGNSEVGHMAIGTGRIIKQPLTIIHDAIADGSFATNPVLNQNLAMLAQQNKALHIMGLLSDAGTHSHIDHLFAYIKSAVQHGIKDIYVHVFLDGRDVAPKSASMYLEKLDAFLKSVGHGRIASLHGRFYAMDRNQNWQRTQETYRILTQPQEMAHSSWRTVLDTNYAQNITDEFIPSTQLNPQGVINPGDGIIFINFRPDRARQLTDCFTEKNFKQFPVKQIALTFFITPVAYNHATHPTQTLFEFSHPINTLKEVLAAHDKHIFSIAETEKYAHVTYFFNGGKENTVAHEVRILIPSIAAKNYIDFPCMSAPLITQAVIKSLKKMPKDFYLINYANADMVGHSANLKATIKAVECLDEELEKLYEVVVQKLSGTLYITADHGKAEEMADNKGNPRTAHTTNLVPFIVLRKGLENSDMVLPLKQLSDIAPFVLEQMQLPVPQEMKSATIVKSND